MSVGRGKGREGKRKEREGEGERVSERVREQGGGEEREITLAPQTHGNRLSCMYVHVCVHEIVQD